MATVSTITNTASSNATSASKASSEATDKFLKILLTELQNQNPLDPVKPTEYTSQLAAYSSLEQQIKTNNKLDSLLDSSAANAVSPVSYLGTTVDYTSRVAPVQGNKATWNYSTSNAASITITVSDALGNTVYTGNGDTTDGMHTLTLTAGSDVPDGAPLTITVTAKDSDGANITPTVTARALVDAVDTSSGTTQLEASGYSFDSSTVTRITKPTTTTTSATSS